MLGSADQTDNSAFWCPIYGIDRKLENLFCALGGQPSHVAFIRGYTNLILDEEKLRMQSMPITILIQGTRV